MNTIYEPDFEKLAKKYRKLLWKFVNNVQIAGMTEEDLYQEMLMVLDKCNKTYDKSKGTRFMTYLYNHLKFHSLNLMNINMQKSNLPYLMSVTQEYYSENHNAADGHFTLDIEDTEASSVEEQALFESMLSELRKMPRGQVTIDLMVDGMHWKDIVKKHNITHQHVYKVNAQNIKKLQELFREE